MNTDIIIVSDYCQKCHIEPSFIALLEEGGLIEVEEHEGESYLYVSQLPELEQYARLYYDLSINKYKEIEYIPVEYPPTEEILANIRELEKEIKANMDELELLLKD